MALRVFRFLLFMPIVLSKYVSTVNNNAKFFSLQPRHLIGTPSHRQRDNPKDNQVRSKQIRREAGLRGGDNAMDILHINGIRMVVRSNNQWHDLIQKITCQFLRLFSVVIGLQAEPETCGGAECTGKAQGGVGGNGALAGADLADPGSRNTDSLGQPVFADPHRFKELVQQDLAGMNIRQSVHSGLQSVIIANFNPFCRSVAPDEANPPLVVDTDTPLPFAIPGEFFQAIGRRDAKVVKSAGVVQHSQLAAGNCLNLVWQLPGERSLPDRLRRVVVECLDHGNIISRADNIVKRYYKGNVR